MTPPQPPTEIQELWADRDKRALEVVRASVAADDLVGALLAIEGAAPEDIATCRHQLYQWGASLHLDPSLATAVVVLKMTGLIHNELEFSGDANNYYHPDNSRLSLVVERRRGLPILLSCIWIVIGEVAGVDVQGVGMPGHFLARVGGDGGILVDPFGGGRIRSPEECKAIFSHVTDGKVLWRDEFLLATPRPQIVERVLWNLINATHRSGELVPCYRHVRTLAELFPERGHLQVLHANLAEQVGALPLALSLFREIAQRFANSPLEQIAARRIEQLEQRIPWVN